MKGSGLNGILPIYCPCLVFEEFCLQGCCKFSEKKNQGKNNKSDPTGRLNNNNENASHDPQVSMAKERKRLINEDLVTDVGPGAVGGTVGVTGQPGRDNQGQDRSSAPAASGEIRLWWRQKQGPGQTCSTETRDTCLHNDLYLL